MRVAAPDLAVFKLEGRRFVMLTAYDFQTAQIFDEVGIPVIFIGDTLGICFAGHPTTIPVTMDDMVHHCAAVSRAVSNALVVGDLPSLGRGGPVVLGAGLAVPFVVLALAGPRPTTSEVGVLTVLLAAFAPAFIWAGSARAAQREARLQSAARQVVAGTLLEHTARGERARIARELHDVVAHHISMVAVQAATARLTTPGMPAAGAQRLSAIGDSARAALTDMRRLLGVLREDAQTDIADRRPQPGIPQLNELIDEARDASGTGFRLILRSPPRPLDPGVELAAYRIAQEALTNARRHAPGAAVDVELHYTDDAVRVRIRDNGPGPSPYPPADGHGLPGMRERAVAVGGRLRTGAASGGGFFVEATLPADADVVR
jgi:signal transduction histidine kinase